MKTILFLMVLPLFILTACTTEVTTDPPEILETAASIGFKVKDSSGNDLLSDKTPGYYSYNDIDYMVETKKKMQVYYNIRQDNPKNISIEKVEGEYCLGVYLLAPADGETMSNTYIRFGGIDIDTIKAEYERVPGGGVKEFEIKKIWYNGVFLKEYDPDKSGTPIIPGVPTVIKQPKK